MDTIKISEETNQDRRRFFGTAAVTPRIGLRARAAVIGRIASAVDQPNVNAKASTPESRNSTSNCRSVMAFCCRIS